MKSLGFESILILTARTPKDLLEGLDAGETRVKPGETLRMAVMNPTPEPKDAHLAIAGVNDLVDALVPAVPSKAHGTITRETGGFRIPVRARSVRFLMTK